MKRLTLCLILVLAGCSAPDDTTAVRNVPMPEMQVEDAPLMAPVMIPCDISAEDGIGGTGCS